MNIEADIRNRISINGYITIAEMINAAMNEFAFSYYKNNKPIGVHSDFITSPEISQLFGEMISLWCIDQWDKLGNPSTSNLIELGAGNGTLIYIILKTIKKIAPDFYNTIKVHVVEINPHLIEAQNKILSNFDINKNWYEKFQDIKTENNIIIANEFFDSLSISQYVKKNNIWHEVIVKTDVTTARLVFDRIPTSLSFSNQLDAEHMNAQDGAIFEESLERIRLMQNISDLILKNRGAALIIDYGYYINPFKRTVSQYNSTLQSVKDHAYNPVLHNIGNADLTSHVDFWELERVAKNRGLNTDNVVTQRDFLLKWGILDRLKVLISKNPKHEKSLLNQYQRIVGIDQMGELFKILCIFNNKNINK